MKEGRKWEEEGRLYTLKKATPEGAATVSAHPGTLLQCRSMVDVYVYVRA